MTNPSKTAAIVLCGGRSARMGSSKAMLAFGSESMLQRVVRLVEPQVAVVVVVAADGQQLPKLDNRVTVVRDRRPDRGPLEGLAAGLQAIADRADAAFVTSCDAPLLAPRLIARLGELLRDYEGVVPRHDGMVQPLTALYRASVLAQVEAMLASNELGVHRLLNRIDALVVDANELRNVDPQLLSFRGCNTPDEYQAALGIAGLVD